MQWVGTKNLGNGILTDALQHAASAYNGTLDGAKVCLFTGAPLLNDRTAFADLTAPLFTGYAVSAGIVWGTPVTNPEGNAQLAGSSATFACTADSAGDIITGVGLFTGTTGNEKLLLAAMLDTTISIAKSGEGFTVLPVIVLNFEDYGAPVIAA